MKRLPAVVAPVVTALLVLGAREARADMCLGGHHPPPMPIQAPPADAAPDAGPTDAGDAGEKTGANPRGLGAGFLIVACVSSGWLALRRKRPGDRP